MTDKTAQQLYTFLSSKEKRVLLAGILTCKTLQYATQCSLPTELHQGGLEQAGLNTQQKRVRGNYADPVSLAYALLVTHLTK